MQEALTGPNLDHLAAGVRGSSLQFTNHFYPTADSLGGGVRVVCACGNAVRGRLLWATDGSPSSSSPNPSSSSGSIEAGSSITRLDQYFAYESYKVGGVTHVLLSQYCLCIFAPCTFCCANVICHGVMITGLTTTLRGHSYGPHRPAAVPYALLWLHCQRLLCRAVQLRAWRG